MAEDCVWYRSYNGELYFKEELKLAYYEECKCNGEARDMAFWVWLNENGFVKIN